MGLLIVNELHGMGQPVLAYAKPSEPAGPVATYDPCVEAKLRAAGKYQAAARMRQGKRPGPCVGSFGTTITTQPITPQPIGLPKLEPIAYRPTSEPSAARIRAQAKRIRTVPRRRSMPLPSRSSRRPGLREQRAAWIKAARRRFPSAVSTRQLPYHRDYNPTGWRGARGNVPPGWRGTATGRPWPAAPTRPGAGRFTPARQLTRRERAVRFVTADVAQKYRAVLERPAGRRFVIRGRAGDTPYARAAARETEGLFRLAAGGRAGQRQFVRQAAGTTARGFAYRYGGR